MTRQEVLKEMVAGFREDFNEILDAVDGSEAGAVLNEETEFEVRRLALRRYAALYQSAVTLRGKEWERKPAPACRCGSKMRMVRRMPKTVMSIVGELRFRRRQYYCEGCKTSRWPFDEEMGIAGGWTPGAVRLMTRAGAKASFEEARTDLKEFAIGTGPQESACKNVIGRRLKGSGMRWTTANAEAMAHLRALMYSTGSWDAFWARRHPLRKTG